MSPTRNFSHRMIQSHCTSRFEYFRPTGLKQLHCQRVGAREWRLSFEKERRLIKTNREKGGERWQREAEREKNRERQIDGDGKIGIEDRYGNEVERGTK